MYFQSFNVFVGFMCVLVSCSQYALAGKELFFPYGLTEGDILACRLNECDEYNTDFISIGQGGFKFYGSQRNGLIINNNGGIFFGNNPLDRYPAVPMPLYEYTAFITPYWGDVNGLLADESTYYRIVTRASGSDDAFDLADAVVRMSYTELQDYQSAWMLIVTFEDLGFYNPFSDEYKHLRNSYQVVLLTNGELSFCIFNYGDITWATSWIHDRSTVGDDIGGDGLGGSAQAQAGFSAGDGVNSYVLEGSGTPDIININTKSNIGVPGRFIFQVNNEVITEPFIPTSELFFPYGSGVGDTSILNQNDFDTPHIMTGTGFKFYGSTRDSLKVSNNGLLFFGDAPPAIANDTVPFDGSIPFIAPYWADADTRVDRGAVYYRNISRDSSSNDGAFDVADGVVKMAYVELQNFQSSWMFLATWDEVSYYQDPVDSQYNHLRNSFQVVLLTDGSVSFSIFNYGDITWTTGAEQGGNGSGLGGTEAQVGFSAGDEMKSYFLEGSQTPYIVDINERSNIGVPGRFIFKINEALITQPQCKSFGKVSIHPLVGSMLGGTEVLIGGTCFNSTSVIKCRFDDKVVSGRLISSMAALCVTPTFFKTGRISLNVSINNGSTFDFSAVFTLENVEDTKLGVTTIATTSQSALDTFAIEWDTNLLMHVETVDVALYGYKEDEENGLVVLENVLSLAENISYQTGFTNITLPSTNTDITYEVGIFAVLEHQDGSSPNNGLDGRAGLWSDVHVLQWLRGQEPTSWCTQWLRENEKENEVIDAAPSCPCTLTLAMLDFARFRRDPSCFQGSAIADNCQRRPGATHCVLAVQPSVESGGQECCYASDGNISNAYISQAGGGFAHRYHHNGIRPYENPTQVPFLSHFIVDTLPWTYCCHLPGEINNNTELSRECSEYIARRPSQMCNGYEPPHLGLGNGDPHITTLDMKRYTFNGHGEFTLLNTLDNSFVLQTRTAPYQDVNATIFVAVAAQCNGSDVIHVEVYDDRIMDAYVRSQDGGDFERIDFEQASSWNYEGVSVSGFNISTTGILIAFEGGAGLHLKAADGALVIQVVPHSSFRGQTRGLMGTWNDDVSDDYTTPEGNVLSPNLTTEEIYFQFGLKWNVSEENSLFYYPVGVTQASVSDLSYIPVLETTMNPTINQSLVENTCKGDGFCTFDFQTTGSASFAQNTAASFQTFQDAIDSTNIVMCPTLGTPDSGNTIVSRYTAGGEANYTCIAGYQISDDVKVTCQSDGTWTNEITPECIDIIKPRITCPGTSSNSSIPGRSVGMISWMEPAVDDNSGIFNVSLVESTSNGGEFPIGISNVTYVVTDGVGLTDTCTFTVNVTDDEDPTIQCPDPIAVQTSPSLDSAVVTWPLLNASDNSGNVEIMPIGKSRNGTNFTIGAVMLFYIASDSSGNTEDCSFWVNVTDVERPTITCPVIPTVPTKEGESYATVTWNEPSISNGTVSDNSGFATPMFQGPGSNGGNFELGTNVLSYRVDDQAGNSNNCSFTITVIDTEKPRITCPSMTPNTTIPGRSVGMVSWVEPIVEDNSGRVFNVSILEPASNGGDFPIGISNVTYIVTDAVGLMDSCTFAVNVSDDEDPTIQCPDPIAVPTSPSLDSAVVTWPLLNASDNSGNVEIMPIWESRNGTNFTIGAVMLFYIARDSSGNTDDCSFWVNVTDMERPAITCPVIPTVPTEEGESYATVTWNEPSISNGTVSDNSGFATPMFLGPGSNGGNFELGTNVLSYRVIDQARNKNNCSFTINVIDNEKPRITCPGTSSNTTIPGRPVGMVSWMEPTVEENSGIFNVSLVEPASNGGEFPIGISNITYIVTDGVGLMDTCNFGVVVIDNEDPIIQCPESVHVTTRPDLPTALVSWVDPTRSDNSGNVDINQVGSFINGGEFMIRVSTITYVATDESGNSNNCSFSVNVTDNQDPIIRNCPSSITTVSRPGLNVTEVSWTPPTATDNSGSVEPIFLGPGSLGGNYSIGTVIGTYVAQDLSGNMDVCTFSITVRDYNDVIVICPENIVEATTPGKASAVVTWAEATIPIGWSNVTVTLEGPITNGGEFPIGETNLTYNALDPDGLNDSCTFFVVVIDEERPNITCPGPIEVTTETNLPNARVTWPEPEATDNSGDVTVSLIGPGSNGGSFNIGDTNVSYRAMDDAGNTSSCIVTVRVIDDEPPVLTCPGPISNTTEAGSARSGSVTWTEPTAKDNSGMVTVSQIGTEQNGGTFNIGVTNISYQAVDESGNNVFCVFSILIEDDEPPTLECPHSRSLFTESGIDSAPVSWTDPSASDNSGAVTASLVGPGSNGGRFIIGATNVTYRAMDDAGNTDTCYFTITIEDNEAPVVTCPSLISMTTQTGTPRSGPITWDEPTATDNSGSVRVSMAGTGTHRNGGTFGIGVTNITYQAVDSSGNIHMCSFIIGVEDDESPVLTCPNPLSATATQDTGIATVSWMKPDASDNSGNLTVSLTGPGYNGGNFSIGLTNLTYTAIDDAGNMKSCVFSISVEDPSSCISDPCLNGGSCTDFSGHFICRCPAGFQGETCQQVTVSCESGSAACDVTERCLDVICQCRPNFIRTNGACISNNKYRLTMTVTSLLGKTLEYVENFADPSSLEFQTIAEDFRGVVLSLTSVINDLVVVQLNPGSVIFMFDGFVNTSLNESSVLTDLLNGIATGSPTDGSLLIALSPNTIPGISDFDECANTTTNDCSPNAYCTNLAGSYECTCYSSFSDESSAQIGSGRTCVFKRGLLIAIICCVVGVVVFIIVCGALCCWCSRLHYINSMNALDGDGFFHSGSSKSTRRNAAPRFGGDNIQMTNESRPASNHPSRTRERTSHSNRGYSYSPTRYSAVRGDQFSRPVVVSGSEPTSMNALDGDGFFHSGSSKSTRRNAAPRFGGDNIQMTNESRPASNHPSRTRERTSHSNRGYSYSPTRYSAVRGDQFSRPYVVSGSEPTGYRGRPGPRIIH